MACVKAAAFHGVDLAIDAFAAEPGEASPSPATLVRWLDDQGLVAKGMRLRWDFLVRLGNTPPVVLLFRDGSASLLMRTSPEEGLVWLADPMMPFGTPPVPVDHLRLSQVWTGDIVLIKRNRNQSEADARFDLAWFVRMVLREKRPMRDILLAALISSILQLFPALIVMQVIDRVVNYHSMATLVSLSAFVIILSVYEILLTYAQKEMSLVVATRLDARISLHAFNRLLMLPLEFYEREQTGEVLGRFAAIFKVRDFITGQMMSTLLDLFVLIVLLPVLFYLCAPLAWMTVAAAGLIGVIVVVTLPAMTRVMGAYIQSDLKRNAVLYETVAGIKTVKTMALEGTRREDWDEATAHVVRWRLASGRLSNWINLLIQPINLFINRGIILVGAYLILIHASGMQAGALMAFMMLSGRVTAPLVGLARLVESFNEVTVSLSEAGSVLNQPTETLALTTGLRPPIKGALDFVHVNYTYPGSSTPALKDINFSIPAGTMLGLVGRSGSGKSTLTRLLLGVSRNYDGFVKLDDVDLREINLHYLRRCMGVVLQDNFLFRGTIKDNITAQRAGLTFEEVVKAARLAEAEEFIERMPAGFNTFIEEGSTNISGGQRQRLAIARAVVTDPKLMILDEATSALDPESEALVNANLEHLGAGRTMVIVSHRLSSLVNCDLIGVMDQGRMVDLAPHHVLVERCEIYRTLWLQQNRHLYKEDVKHDEEVMEKWDAHEKEESVQKAKMQKNGEADR
ncbi:peptidase domain-containing ABC transporter [Oecophyllibacter saccharovorans]|uniref:peptidase domain-containing ABC transporter n=1 Tax=Oecophyllibacter saccharovorans TaxID=2558360 RepID=UPI001F4F933F|nr:peptidase domain-containing ABC transporter [Oecophyllibacter saccharovorans]